MYVILPIHFSPNEKMENLHMMVAVLDYRNCCWICPDHAGDYRIQDQVVCDDALRVAVWTEPLAQLLVDGPARQVQLCPLILCIS